MSEAPEIIRFKYKPTARERPEGSRMLRAGRGKRRRLTVRMALLSSFLNLAMIGCIAWGEYMTLRKHELSTGLSRLAFAAVVGGVVLWTCCFNGWFIVALLWEAWRNQNREYAITEAGLNVITARGSITQKWSRFIGIERGPQTIVLRIGADDGFVLPIRLLGDAAQAERIESLLQERIRKPAVAAAMGFPVITL